MSKREKLPFLIPSGTAKGVRKDVSCSVRMDCDGAVSMATGFSFFSVVQQLNEATIKNS